MNSESLSTQAEVELWRSLIEPTEEVYPWSPNEPQSEDYYKRLEESLELDLPEAEVSDRAQQFFAHLDRLWASVSSPSASLVEVLKARFAAQVPTAMLAAIAQKAEQVATTSLSLASQLVSCVEEAIPQLHAEDLEVLARPLAFAMRGTEADAAIDGMLNTVRPVEWAALSEIEQARLSLAVARYAIAQLQQDR
ncbi:hypothetical protein H6G20_03255 [Desertifilum sp. FACHB-1129]|nr:MULTISPECIES: hypothetical protein [Cyanophyceae]MCD8485535.1 hypothetical protein [Desertifilum sp.]MDA0209813.1 hypothetical protein [Cyanobacteria bacterium FC1]MDI9635969.1 hypothetical protein [Geitlerinema splendidum]MBD2310696.1 hypothetical protein [Desertifilum sp. FACHB-1129]MBD2320733.1 hypothetical protein [Desertifilum sp. FACHB-866]